MSDDEDGDGEDIDPDNVEADLDTILKDRLAAGDDEDEDEEVDCSCGCQVGILPWEESFGTITTRGDVCDSCLEAVYEAAISAGEPHDDLLYTYMLARTTGADIFDHECEAEDDEDVDCNCGCRRG